MRRAHSSNETQGDAYQTPSNQEALLELVFGADLETGNNNNS